MLRSAYGNSSVSYATKVTVFLQKFPRLCLSLIFLIPLAAFNPIGESQVVTLNFKDAPLSKVFTEIRKQTGYTFTYSEKDILNAKPITVNVANVRIFDAMGVILQGQSLTFTVIERVIIIKEKAERKISVDINGINLFQTSIDVRGRVLNEQKDPVAGVSIQLKGNGKIGTSTNSDGEYGLKKIDPNSVLVVTGVNIQPVEISVNGQQRLDISVQGRTGKLDEVQVIAYGKSSQRMNLGVVTTINSDDIKNQPVNNPLLALSGRVPGLQVIQQNGISGGGITVRIQGRNNLDNSLVGSDPFIVIDGVPYASQNLSTFKGGSSDAPILGTSSNDGLLSSNNFGNPLAFLNPADIESISVLRDADATAIYGSRAANGAILITTKRGKAGSMKTSVNFQRGWGKVPKKMKLLNTEEYMEMRREAKRNDGRPIRQSDYDLKGTWDTTRYTDWQDELIGGSAIFTRLSASLSGGSNSLQYFIGSTYGKETTVFPGNFANSFGSLQFNFTVSSANQRFKLQLGGNYVVNVNKLPSVDYTLFALNLPPVAPALYNADGSLNWAPDSVGNSTWYNPLLRNHTLFETRTKNLIGNGSLSYRILPGLDLKSTFGYTSKSSDQFNAALDESEKPEYRENRLRIADFSYNSSYSWIVEPQLSFQQRWKDHSLNVLIGTSFQYQKNDGRAFQAYGHSNDLLLRNMLAGTGLYNTGIDVSEYKYNAIFGRISYDYRQKYLLNLSGRRDGSSRFGRESQFNNFAAVGAGYILSQEDFFKKGLPFISFAKLRASYGTTGNDQIGDYRFLYLFDSYYSTIPYQGGSESKPLGLPNPYLEWEETRKLQVGADLGIWNDRLLFTFNYYRNRSSNSLTTVNMPLMTGFSSLIMNLPALLQNTGVECVVSANNINIGKVRIAGNINLTVPSSKVVEFPGLETSPLKLTTMVGYPLNTLKTYPFYGVDVQTGIYKVKSLSGQPTSTPNVNDRTVFLNRNSRMYGGFQGSMVYKQFSFDFLFQFVQKKGSDVIYLISKPGTFSVSEPFNVVGNQPEWVMDRWQKPGDISKYEKFASTTAVLGANVGDYMFHDISFVRLKNLSISYTLNGNLTKKMKIDQLRLFANGQNLLTFTRYRGLDPETMSLTSLPPLRIVTFGIQVDF